MRHIFQLWAFAWLFVATVGGGVSAQVSDDTPRSRRVDSASTQSASIHWENVPLGDALERVSDVFGAAIFVDRRVDRSRRIRLKVEQATLDEILRQLAADQSLGVSLIGPVTYLGPAIAIPRFEAASAAARLQKDLLSAESQAELAELKPMHWSRLSAPRTLVAQAIEQRAWRVRDAERIPHDLWDEFQLPEMSLPDQLSLLLVGFDLSFRFVPDERVIQIVPLESGVSDATPQVISQSDGRGSLLEQRLPMKGVERGDALRSSPRAQETPRALAEGIEGAPRESERQPTKSRPRTKQVYTLRVEEQPIGVVLRGLGQRLGWQLEIDQAAIHAAGRSLDRRVSFSVKNADLDELLEALLTPAGLTFEIDGPHVSISARTD